jgi:hypothetical protein
LYYDKIDVDLSGNSELLMFLWAKRGKGTDCICKLNVTARPSGISGIARRGRESMLLGKGIKITSNENVHIELHGEMSVKIGKGGFAIDSIRVCRTSDESDIAKKDGYKLVCDLMKYTLPCSIWDHKREPYNDPDLYKMGAIPKMEWMDKRLKRCIESFNLKESEVLYLRTSFEVAQGNFINEEMGVTTWLRHLDFPENSTIAKWVTDACDPKKKGELTFSEYVHTICFFCVFAKKELIRFLFGAMDAKKNLYLRRDEFYQFTEILAEDTVRNPKLWKKQWETYMNPSLKAIFLDEFLIFVDVNPSVLWQTQLLQKKIMEKNLGVKWWNDRVDDFMYMREQIGVVML